jgi:hypothetical protein
MAQIHTGAQRDVDTQHWTAQTKGEKQNDVVHDTADDFICINESNGDAMLLRVQYRLVIIHVAPMRRPIDSRKQFQEPLDIFRPRGACENDEDKGDYTREDLERDGVHVDWDIRGEKSGPTLVAVVEGRGDLSNIHDPLSVLDTG